MLFSLLGGSGKTNKTMKPIYFNPNVSVFHHISHVIDLTATIGLVPIRIE